MLNLTRCLQDADVKTEKVAQEDRISVEGTAPWLVVPSVLLLSATGRMFDIEVDAESLPEGLSTAEVRGIDATAPWRGALFRCLHASCVLFSSFLSASLDASRCESMLLGLQGGEDQGSLSNILPVLEK